MAQSLGGAQDALSWGWGTLVLLGYAAFMAALGGAVMVAAKPISSSCSSGDHDACREWWLAPLGPAAAGLGCQCECHDVIW